MYKRILVAVDGSPVSNKALVAALQMARESGGQVRLIHSIDEMPYFTGIDGGAGSVDVLGILRAGGTRVLADALAIAQSAGVTADTLLTEDFGVRLGDTVAEAARQWNADLIVLGTHGRHGIGRLMLGSGAEQIIRAAPVAVLVVRNTESGEAA
jgi:nucleotide-binding universal stress UspA family protein